jgi:hypothetical protein
MSSNDDPVNPQNQDTESVNEPKPTNKSRILTFNAYEKWGGTETECPHCSWRGRLSDESTHLESDHLEALCGNCHEAVAYIWFPNKAEAEAAGDEQTIAMFKVMESYWGRFSRQCLKSADQLPEIDSDEIVITWDTVESWNMVESSPESRGTYTYFMYRDVVLFREPACFEHGSRYGEVAAIFRGKYGDRLKDIVPTWRGWMYLGGDSFRSLNEAETARAAFFGPPVKAQHQEPANEPEKSSEKPSPEAMKKVIQGVKLWLEEGFGSPKMEDSLLGLDWSVFVTREFPEHAGDTSFWDPPEFISYAFRALDAYATAMLAAHFRFISLGALKFRCRLTPPDTRRDKY